MIYILLALALAASVSARGLNQRIVGGSEAYVGQFPHQGSLQYASGSHTCGCSLIGSYKVLTAAHCVSSSPSSYRIGFGIHDRSDPTVGTPLYYSVSGIIIHPNYNPDGNLGFPNDVAVMYTSSMVEINEHTAVIELASASAPDYVDSIGTISGWGLLSGGGSLPYTLRYVDIRIISNYQCASMTNPNFVNDGHICVHSDNDLSGGCNGDSGGPLTLNNQLVGVTSWVIGSCDTSYPTAYSRVSYFRKWIDSV